MESLLYLGIMLAVICIWFLAFKRPVYEAVLLETLPADATEDMITAGFDLSLYTCTPGGGSRVTARCKIFNP